MTNVDSQLESLTKEELIKAIKILEEELKLKDAFSITQDTGTNDAALMWRGRDRFLAESAKPVNLKNIASKGYPVGIGGENWIIDGDNLPVMRSLLREFRGGVNRGFDVVYIDPPYNTGSEAFSYNDTYKFSRSEINRYRRQSSIVEKIVTLEDPTRHTKWINHIAPRLWAAKKLMKSTGIIIVSIDEHELPRLWMLMEEMFGEKNRIATLVWERSRKNDIGYISEGHEYMLIWARDKNALDEKRKRLADTPEHARYGGKWRKRKEGAEEILSAYAEGKALYGDNIELIQQHLDRFFEDLPREHPAKSIRHRRVDAYGVFNDDGNLNWPGGGGPRYDVLHPDTGLPCKVPKSGWRISTPEAMQELIDQGKIAFKKDHKGIPRMKTYLHDMDSEVATSVIKKTGQRAVETLEKLLGKGFFQNPKDHEILAELFKLATWGDPNAKFFDPYAGSGTTAHAVLALNAEDGGNRQFVLIESGDPSNKRINREEYADKITAQRVRNLISGDWASGTKHAPLSGGFNFYEAKKTVSRKMIMESDRENLADLILQVVEENSNRVDCRVDGYDYLIGRTKLGYGIALIWQAGSSNGHQPLNRDLRSKIISEARSAGVNLPVYIYAVANTAPENDDLYRFQQIPDSILTRLNLLDEEDIE